MYYAPAVACAARPAADHYAHPNRGVFLTLLKLNAMTAAVAPFGRAPVYNLGAPRACRANYPKVHDACLSRHKRSQLWQPRPRPTVSFTPGGFVLAPTFGTTFTADPRRRAQLEHGAAWQVGIEGAIPLWTFASHEPVGPAEAEVAVGSTI